MAIHRMRAVLGHGHGRASVGCWDVRVVDLSVVELVLRSDGLCLSGHGVVPLDGVRRVACATEGGMVLVWGVLVLRCVAGLVLSAAGPLCGEGDVRAWRVLLGASVRHWREP